MTTLVVVALGGNALSPPTGDTSLGAERSSISQAAAELVACFGRDTRLLVVHGNGTQVGRCLGADPDLTDLDVRVAQTQGELGYLLVEALERAGLGAGTCVSLVTRALVAPDDPAWATPEKPIGPAVAALSVGVPAMAVPGGWGVRRVVASPRPRAIVELEAIRTLLARQHVVAGGGGGVPLVVDACGLHVPRPAVIDKDHVAALLAVALDAQRLVFVTNVSSAYDEHGGAMPRPIRVMTVAAARERLAAGVFGPGSMAPKVESAVTFVAATSRPAVIAGLGEVAPALRGAAGTTVTAPVAR